MRTRLFPVCCAAATVAALACGLGVPEGRAQALPKHEFRGAWIATVAHLDWPDRPGAPAAEQQADMVRLLDLLQEAGVNAVLFQVRNEADALYASPYEPWSNVLTGFQGQDPGYDPLAFVVAEGHRRGMEVHAWFNPYRVWIKARNYPRDPSSLMISRPEWLLTVNGEISILDPGIPAVQEYLVEVIRDVVTRYDIDGVHFDDYFYPYPPNQPSLEDYATYQAYGSGTAGIGTWRQENVNALIRRVREMLAATRPFVKFGISPFGIWKSGTPAGIVGLSGATDLYADALAWLDQRWIDYLAPQLYWPIAFDDRSAQQDYAALAPWWGMQTQSSGRHLYPGLAVHCSDPSASAGCRHAYGPSEIPDQIRLNRAAGTIDGQILFRAKFLTHFASAGLADSLSGRLYRTPALTPTMPWKDVIPPAPPPMLGFAYEGSDAVALWWERPRSDGFAPEARFFAVYRAASAEAPDWNALTRDAQHLVTVTSDTSWIDRPAAAPVPYHYTVTAVSANSVESDIAGNLVVEGRATRSDVHVTPPLSLSAAFPNPFRERTTLSIDVPAASPVTVDVYDVLGRRVDRILDGAWRGGGESTITWTPNVVPGTYFVVMRVGAQVRARAVAFIR